MIPAIDLYVKDVYPDLHDKPLPQVLCCDDHQFKKALNVRDSKKSGVEAAYIIPANTIYFRNRPLTVGIAHEMEHWAQAMRLGSDVYVEELQNEALFRQYERRCDEVALANAHRLAGKY